MRWAPQGSLGGGGEHERAISFVHIDLPKVLTDREQNVYRIVKPTAPSKESDISSIYFCYFYVGEPMNVITSLVTTS